MLFCWWIRYPSRKTLLVVDLYAPHRFEEVLSFLRGREVDCLFVPADCTSLVQLVDVSVNRQFKHHYREKFSAWRGLQSELRRPTRKKITRFVVHALRAFRAEDAYSEAFERLFLPALQRNVNTVPVRGVQSLRANTLVVPATTVEAQREKELVSRVFQEMHVEGISVDE